MGGHKPETVVQVQQTATQNQDTSIGTKDLTGIIDNLVSVLLEQAKNPAQPTSVVVPVNTAAGQQGQETYNNSMVNQLLTKMYYDTFLGQQKVNPQTAPVNLTSIMIAAAVVIIAILYTRRN